MKHRDPVLPKILTSKQREDFMVYSQDHHLMADTILTITYTEAVNVLLLVGKNWPTSLAHSLAIAMPDTQLQFDTVEHRLHEQMELPL